MTGSDMGGGRAPSPSRFCEAARDLAERGYHVFPLKPRGKTPLTTNGWKDATRDERKILHWWDRRPDANVGIACGPSGIAVLDLDAKHGCDAEEVIGTLNGAVIIRTGEAPERTEELPDSLAGERGAHAYYRAEMRTVPKVDGHPGVEVRAAGAYVCAPPSVHPSGVEYTGDLPDISRLPQAPGWLLRLAERSSNGATGTGAGEAPTVDRVPPGGMHEYLADLAVRLARAGQRDVAVVEAQLVAAFDTKRVPGARYAGGPGDTRRLAEWAVETAIANRERAREQAREQDVPAGEARAAVVTPAAEIRTERVYWVWKPRMPLRNLSVVGGEAGLGKSLFTNALLAAGLTLGTLPGDLHGTPCDVLVVSGEDDWAGTIKPRLIAAGADLNRVHRLEIRTGDGIGMLTLPDDVPRVAAAVTRLRADGKRVAAVVIDPIGAFLHENIDSHKTASVRRALAPLAQLASDHDLAVVVVAHLNKDESQKLLNRLSGSGAFGQAPRSVLAFARDPEDDEGERGRRRVIVHVKSNVGTFAPTLAAHVESFTYMTDDGDELADTGLLVIDGESDVTAEDLQRAGKSNDSESIEEAIVAALDGRGDRPSLEVKEEVSKRVGCSLRTVERHAGKMRDRREVVVELRGFPATAQWRLAVATSPTTPNVATDVATEGSAAQSQKPDPPPPSSDTPGDVSQPDGGVATGGAQQAFDGAPADWRDQLRREHGVDQ